MGLAASRCHYLFTWLAADSCPLFFAHLLFCLMPEQPSQLIRTHHLTSAPAYYYPFTPAHITRRVHTHPTDTNLPHSIPTN